MGLFSAPTPPKVEAPPPPPQVDASAAEADARRKLAQRTGRNATLMTSTAGAPPTGQTRRSTLLGQMTSGQ